MGARFAGSQRLGDRRRRRLAVETDDVSGDAGQRRAMPAPPAGTRALESAHAAGSADHATPSFDHAVAAVVPRRWWKYVIGGMTCLSIAGGLVTAGACASDLSAALGPGIERLFAFPDGTAAIWFSSLLLSVSAQLSFFIWWVRSQSEKDFEGRYWLWIKVMCAWLLFGGCVATAAHAAAQSTLMHLWPGINFRTATLGWLVPAAAAGIATLISLAREMRGCRWSRALLLLGAVAYLSAAGLHLELEARLTPGTRRLSLEAFLLAGHVAVFMSMWLHARHVLYCTFDPANTPKSRWRLPRPHFRLPRLGWNRNQPTGAPTAEAPPARRKRPATSAESEPQRSTAPERGPAGATPREQAGSARNSQFPIDSRQEHLSARPDEPAIQTIPAFTGDRAPADAASGGSANPRPRDAAAEATPAADRDPRDGSAGEPCESDPGAGDAEDVPSKPDLRGLSKKQRRRLMQELRERERAGSR
jgi:hypothetical protein